MHDRKTEATLFIAGALLGAAVGLLWAPQKGARTRRTLGRKARRTISHLDDLQYDIRGQVDEWVQDVSEAVDEGVHRGKKLSSAGRERVLGVFEDARRKLDEGRQRIERLVRSAD